MTAAPQHFVAQMDAILELAQIRSVAGGDHRDMRKKAPHQRTDQPEVMGVDDIRVEFRHRVGQHPLENGFVGIDFGCRQIDKPRAGVGHDIRHAGNPERNIVSVEPHKAALFGRYAVEFRITIGLDAGNHDIVMARGSGLPHHGLQIDAAAGGVRPLTEHMQNF